MYGGRNARPGPQGGATWTRLSFPRGTASECGESLPKRSGQTAQAAPDAGKPSMRVICGCRQSVTTRSPLVIATWVATFTHTASMPYSQPPAQSQASTRSPITTVKPCSRQFRTTIRSCVVINVRGTGGHMSLLSCHSRRWKPRHMLPYSQQNRQRDCVQLVTGPLPPLCRMGTRLWHQQAPRSPSIQDSSMLVVHPLCRT